MGETGEPRQLRPRAPLEPAVLLATAAGGALGAPARYEIAQLVHVTPGTFPWATFVTNLSGAFVLGLFLPFVIERFSRTRLIRPFFAVGFLGSYTTFSTFAAETVLLLKDGHVALGVGYTIASISAGLVVAYGGIVVGRTLAGGR
ncbi:MAG: CrcB family protein [Actinobacteria bacterium]|nr:CrcB family protein [Actinomycetota bacterium]